MKHLNVTWLYNGPRNDGGYNTEQEIAMNAMGSLPGVTVKGIYNVPYSSQATQLVNEAIANGSNVIVDVSGLTTLLTAACKEHPQVYCYSAYGFPPVPSNTVAFWPEDWDLEWPAGVAAGLMTKTNVVGVVAPSKSPSTLSYINGFALGCQSVDPKCKVRVVYTNAYYNPPADAQAANALINEGADVLRNYVDDPSSCQVAARRHVYSVGGFANLEPVCPTSVITSTLLDYSNYFQAQAKAIQAGTFHGSGANAVVIRVSSKTGSPRLGTWGSFVPAKVKAKVTKVFDEILAGKNFFVGPIRDQAGKVRIGAGQAVPLSYQIGSQWTWPVLGVIGG